MQRAIARLGLGLLLVPLVGVLPAQASLTSPANGAVVAGVVTITENAGECCGTIIHVYNSGGGEVAAWSNGGGGLSVSWVTENHPNGAYSIRSEGRYCHRKLFGRCIDHRWRDISWISVTVRNTTGIIYQGATSGVWDDTVTMAATLYDATTGWAVVNRWVRFVIGDQTAYGVTNGSGYATASIRIGGSGTTTASVNFDGDAYYVGSSAAISFPVSPVPAAVTIEGPFSGTWGNEITVSAVLTKAGPRTGALAGRPVTLTLGPRSATGVTDAAGRFAQTFLLDFTPGTYALSMAFGGDPQVQAASGTATFGTNKRGTTLVYAGAGASPWNDEAELAAYLLDPAGGVGVWGEIVRFQVGTREVTAVTDVDGYARVMTLMTDDPGTYPVGVSYAGDATYAAASTGSALTVARRTTTLQMSAPASGRWQEQVTLTGTLRDAVTGDPLPSRTVDVALGTSGAPATTNAQGALSLSLSLDDVPGAYGIAGTFAGQTHYAPAAVTLPFEILRRPVQVRFAGQRRADDALTGAAWATFGARVSDVATGTGVAGMPVSVTAMDTTLAFTTAPDGTAHEAARIAKPSGLYPLTVEAIGTPYYLPATSAGVSAVGWETFTDTDGDGAVFIDVTGKRVRAIVPLDDPTADTGALDAPGLTVNPDGSLSLVRGGANQKVSGSFDPARATFSADVEEPAGSTQTLARDTNTAPAVTAPADISTDESTVVAFAASPSDAEGGTLYTWWDFGDQGSADGTGVTHTYDDTVVDDRTFTATVTVADAAGARTRDTLTVNVADIDAPDPPVIVLPTEDAALASGSLTVSGTVEPGATVTLTDAGVARPGAAIADDDGAWSIDLDLEEGPHDLRASAVDVDGYPSVPSAPRAVIVDLTPPTATVVEPLARAYNGSGWSAGCGLCGTAADGGSGVDGVEVSIGRVADGATYDGSAFVAGEPVWLPANGTTSWSRPFAYEAFGADGAYTVASRVTDVAGNGSIGAPVEIEIDSVAPSQPLITAPADGVTLNRTTIEVTGTAEPGATIRAIDGERIVGGAPVLADGTWTASVTLDRGAHTLTAIATDPAGNDSPATAPVAVTIDTDAPAAPRIVTPIEAASLNATDVSVLGDAEAASIVRLYDAGVQIAQATAAPDATFRIDVVLAEGAHALTATATDAGTNVSEPSVARALTVDLTAPPAPVVSAPGDGAALATLTPEFTGTAEPRSTVVVREAGETVGAADTGDDGAWTTTITLAEGAHALSFAAIDAATNEGPAAGRALVLDVTPPPPPRIVTPDRDVAVSSTVAHLDGVAQPGDEVVVTADRAGDAAQPVPVSVIADAAGAWSVDLDIGEGDYVVTATITDAAGNASVDVVQMRLDVTAPVAPTVISPFAGAEYGSATIGARGTAEPQARIEIAEAGTPLALATVLPDGAWNATLSLPDGAHTLAVTAIDAAGNRSATTARAFSIDTTPEVPRIFSPLADARLDSRVVPVTGEGPVGGTVEIIEDGTVIATQRISAQASFAMELTMAEGPHVIVARATDASGNLAPLSDPRPFTVDTAAPLIVTPGEGATTGARLAITGNARPGESIVVLEGNRRLGTTIAAADGGWSMTVPFSAGAHAIVAARANGSAVEAPSDPRTFTVDDTPPATTLTAASTFLPGEQIAVNGTATDPAGVVRVEVRYTDVLTNATIIGAPVCTGCGGGATSVTFIDRPALLPGMWRADLFATDTHGNRSARRSVTFIVI